MYKVVPAKAFGGIAVTMEDLYPDDEWNFVFGLANMMTKRGIFSFARYDPAFYGDTESGTE
jgi:archaemetzincin